MLDTSKLDEVLEITEIRDRKFEPCPVNCEKKKFMAEEKEIPQEDNIVVDFGQEPIDSKAISPKTTDKQVIAIDSTSMPLGNIQDGLIGVIRVSQIIREKAQKKLRMERYGPKIIEIKNQMREQLYKDVFQFVCGEHPARTFGPDNVKVLDGIRNLYEKFIQSNSLKSNHNSFIMFDGSLLGGGTVTNIKKFMKEMIDDARENNNELIGISKSTNLTLKSNGRSILSLLEHEDKPTFVGPLNKYIDVVHSSQYFGNIYVAKLKQSGQPFRIDLPKIPIEESQTIFNQLSGLSGYYGYPEELKFAHTTCVHSAVEILALQAYAIKKYRMQMYENLRSLIFAPFTR